MKPYPFIVLSIILMHSLSFAQNKNNKTDSFRVWGNCEQCKSRIENTLAHMGAYTYNWDIQTKILTVSFDSLRLNRSSIQKKLAAVGHDTEGFQADIRVYNKLPECCKYDRLDADQLATKDRDTVSLQPNGQPMLKTISGSVGMEGPSGKFIPLQNATIQCMESSTSVITDSLGAFQITVVSNDRLLISHVGMKTVTVKAISQGPLQILLMKNGAVNLKDVVVTSRMPASYIASKNVMNTLMITNRELTKAACCNLSESFETSPAVDVSYADAVTGIKQIQLLGLSGNYTQIITETVPEIQGLAGSYGLTFIPGPWIDGIQVTKGTGSVVNGFESIAGQINIEEKKPDAKDKLFINSYVNSMGRMEASVDLSTRLDTDWSTGLLLHANGSFTRKDDNHDGFLDNPLGRQLNVMNRWKYMNAKGWIVQFALKALEDQRQAGEVGFDPATDKFSTRHYGAGMDVQQFIVTGKAGYVFPEKKYKSIGVVFSGNRYNNDSYYGLAKYTAIQSSAYVNFIYQSIIGNTHHKFRTGLSVTGGRYQEAYRLNSFNRTENVPGAFFEYTFTPNSKWTAVAGLRADHHNQYGWMATPRLHVKYDVDSKTSFRLSAGSGFRTASVLAENTGLMASSRQFMMVNTTGNYGYGFKPEKAWNIGLSFNHQFKINQHAGSVALDGYHTWFISQVVADVDADPQKVLFYDLAGKSFSNSIQAEIKYKPVKNLQVDAAYRWLDVEANEHGQMLQKPLTASHRGFVNLDYESAGRWRFDYTVQWLGKKRLPVTVSNPAPYQVGEFSPAFFQMSAQASKKFGKRWEVYAGVENLTDYRQKNLILSAAQPFGPYFDGSIIWGPVIGRMFYAGMRFKM